MAEQITNQSRFKRLTNRYRLVVMNDQVHRAARVRKTASLAMAAFESPGCGPLGDVVEGVVLYRHPPGRREVLPLPYRIDQRVALLEACLDADTALLQAVAALGYEGVVIAGFGAGHVSASWSEVLEHLADVGGKLGDVLSLTIVKQHFGARTAEGCPRK